MIYPEQATAVVPLEDFNKSSFRKRFLRFVCVGAFVVSFLTASLVFGFVISYWSQRETNENTPTKESFSPEELQERYSIFRMTVGKLSDALDLLESHTPQSQALDWLVYDDTALSHDNVDLAALAIRYALMVVYFTSNGQDNWLGRANVPTCDWDAVRCDVDETVRHLNLKDSFLFGALPNELSLLSSLKSLDLSGNNFEGSIPSRVLARLTDLESLDVSGNEFAGSIPSELGLLSALTLLDVSRNLLSGELPAELQGLSNLESIDLSSNALEGALFESLVRFWPKLKSLTCRNTEMSGQVVDLPSGLQDLDMSSTAFTGTLANLPKLPALTHLRVASNEFAGRLPPFANFPNIETLTFEANSFTGTVPSDIGDLSHLEKFQLILSNVQGSIPSEIGLCTKLQTIHLTSNKISGTVRITGLASSPLTLRPIPLQVPTELANLPNLRSLTIQRNRGLTGGVPSVLCPAIKTRLTFNRDCRLPCECCERSFCL